MKKTLFLLPTFFGYLFVFAQDTPKLENDTLYYAAQKFWVGKEVTLSYGSSSTREFAFVIIGSGLGGTSHLESGWAKSIVKIDKVTILQGKYFARGKLVGTKGMGPMKVFINIEGAVDNKELKPDE